VVSNVHKGGGSNQPAPGQVPQQMLKCPICGRSIQTVNETPGVSLTWTCLGGHSGTVLASS
jgi:hypothetical protein